MHALPSEGEHLPEMVPRSLLLVLAEAMHELVPAVLNGSSLYIPQPLSQSFFTALLVLLCGAFEHPELLDGDDPGLEEDLAALSVADGIE